MHISSRWMGLIAALITVLIWTAFILIARASADKTLLPFDIALLRIVGAASVLMPWAWWLNRHRGPSDLASGSLWGFSPLPLRITAQAGLFGGLAYALLVYTGFFFAPAGHAAVLLPGSLPLWTALLAFVFLRESISPSRIVGLACIVLGDVMVGGSSLLHAFEGGTVWVGDLIFMLASLCWASYSVTARHHRLDALHATMAITAFAFVCFVPVYVLGAVLGFWPSHLAQAPGSEIAFQMLMQGVGSVVISGVTFTLMLRHYGAVRSTMITALVPALAALGAVHFLNEPLTLPLVLGLLLVTVGIAVGVLLPLWRARGAHA
jgi:drug/metabolite transporter (DMT)-like permease